MLTPTSPPPEASTYRHDPAPQALATDRFSDAAMAPQTRQRPSWVFTWSHPAHAIALGFGAGNAPRAPGTVGTLWAWAAFVLLQTRVQHDAIWAAVLAVSLLLGWWACTVTGRHLNEPDSSHMVWDEVVAFWLILWLIGPATLWEQVAAFALFRLLDACKWGPMAWADQHFKGLGWRGGWGVMFDDLMAAACTLLVFALWRF